MNHKILFRYDYHLFIRNREWCTFILCLRVKISKISVVIVQETHVGKIYFNLTQMPLTDVAIINIIRKLAISITP